MNKEDRVYKPNGILFSHEKEWNDAIGSNMCGSRDYLNKWSKSERQTPQDIAYTQNLKHNSGDFLDETETDAQTQRTGLWLPNGPGKDGLEI